MYIIPLEGWFPCLIFWGFFLPLGEPLPLNPPDYYRGEGVNEEGEGVNEEGASPLLDTPWPEITLYF
jgi:hypothetical protein